jgi:hypothetical protein
LLSQLAASSVGASAVSPSPASASSFSPESAGYSLPLPQPPASFNLTLPPPPSRLAPQTSASPGTYLADPGFFGFGSDSRPEVVASSPPPLPSQAEPRNEGSVSTARHWPGSPVSNVSNVSSVASSPDVLTSSNKDLMLSGLQNCGAHLSSIQRRISAFTRASENDPASSMSATAFRFEVDGLDQRLDILATQFRENAFNELDFFTQLQDIALGLQELDQRMTRVLPASFDSTSSSSSILLPTSTAHAATVKILSEAPIGDSDMGIEPDSPVLHAALTIPSETMITIRNNLQASVPPGATAALHNSSEVTSVPFGATATLPIPSEVANVPFGVLRNPPEIPLALDTLQNYSGFGKIHSVRSVGSSNYHPYHSPSHTGFRSSDQIILHVSDPSPPIPAGQFNASTQSQAWRFTPTSSGHPLPPPSYQNTPTSSGHPLLPTNYQSTPTPPHSFQQFTSQYPQQQSSFSFRP